MNIQDKKRVERAVKKAKWVDLRPQKPEDRPFKGNFHEKDSGCFPLNCWHAWWCINDLRNTNSEGWYIEVSQCWSRKEAIDKIYKLAASLLKVKVR